ncbi:unnamed protein product [Didymodactylos carnosus]|uniref:Uncharacterized protein n=1 Tax=Didymodactylos carnosus TaxID=1234261 RepID=A0A816AVK0_9BILA|nr:unnamed protein product [Didymodactylos carnosus]CAF1603383.1 unnamed protein product [Didymodactylos carnosus]CAF4413140.1 unnamed protein product [Didymodactylos carnosus]CAF4480675.1 unnamed protein product [Didymodactylos carnosus]
MAAINQMVYNFNDEQLRPPPQLQQQKNKKRESAGINHAQQKRPHQATKKLTSRCLSQLIITDDDDSDADHPPTRKTNNNFTAASILETPSSITILKTPKLTGTKLLHTNTTIKNNDDDTDVEQIYVPLEDPEMEQPDDKKTFETTIMFTNPTTGVDVDLLKVDGVKSKMNLYVTALIEFIFTKQQLVDLNPLQAKQDHR